jgi:ATP-binding cassette subfamily B (MDR/TAP) protein 1
MRDNPDVSLLNIFYAIMAITWAGWYAGNNFYFMPDVVEGKRSAQALFDILDTEDEDQLQVRHGSKMQKTPIRGNIEFRNVSFGYKKGQTTIANLSLTIKQGEKAAFVGPSGCGKSTLVQLLQRFYDCNGLIIVDGVDVRDYELHYLRSHFAIVSQEPSLFTGTLRENIKYNLDASQEQLDACTAKA